MNDSAIFETHIDYLQMLARGKVRDIYAIDDAHMLIVTTDRFSAFDVVFNEPIPHKGELLTEVSNFWFARTAATIRNHLTSLDLRDYVSAEDYEMLKKRSIIVRRMQTLPVEAIVRGYVIGSGWKDYQASGAICGIKLPPGLQQAAQLPEPIFTPSTKAEVGDHDINVSFDDVVAKIGADKAEQIRSKSIQLYRQAAEYAASRGIIIADTKFEFDARLVALLAGRPVPRRHQPAKFRQAVRARLPGDAGLGQDTTGTQASGRYHREITAELSAHPRHPARLIRARGFEPRSRERSFR